MQQGIRIAIAVTVLFSLAEAASAQRRHPKLEKARINAARAAYHAVSAKWTAGVGDSESVYLWSVRWLEAARDRPSRKSALVAATSDHLARMKKLEAAVKTRVRAGTSRPAEALAAAYYLAEARLWHARAKTGKGN